MRKFAVLFLCATFPVCLNAAAVAVPLGSASAFGVLAGSTVTSTGATHVIGDLGVSPGSAVTGFPPGTVTGTIYAADPTAAQAEADLTSAYNFALAETGAVLHAAELGGTVVTPGVYNFGSSAQITGTVTLNGSGVYVFQIPSTLITASGSQVSLTGGATAANVFWQVGSSATLGSGSTVNGTIMAYASITLDTGAVLNGRALAEVGAVTLDDNAVTNPGGTLPPPTLAVSCPSNTAQIGVLYNSALVATGGTLPYMYSINPGSLPPGLVLNSNGRVTGIPTGTGGIDSFFADVLDGLGNTATRGCVITTTAAGLPPPGTPAPSSVLLVAVGLACAALYKERERILRHLRKI